QLARFVGSPDNPGGGRLAAGLPGDSQHQRQVIAAAIEKAQAHWLAATQVSRNPEFRWWSELVERCGEVREQYSRLLEARRDFDNAGQIRSYQQVRERWLATFPQPNGAAPPADSPVLLLDQVRAHLASDPPLADGRIVVPEKLVQLAQQRNEAFWKTVIAALRKSVSDPQDPFAEEQISRISEFQTIFHDKMRAAGNRFVPEVDRLGLVVQALPSIVAPKRFALTTAAERVERVTTELAKALSPAAATDSPSLTSWANRLRELTQKEKQPDLPEVGPEWQSQRLGQLARSIQEARRRVELQMVVEQIAAKLDPLPQQGLAELMDGHDEPAKSLRFAGLANRHSETFMLRTVRGKQDLCAALDTAVEQGLLVDDSLQLSLLSRGLERYLEHFLTDWSQAYDRYRLAPLREYDLPRRWTEYRRWMRNNAQTLRTEYQSHLDAVMLNIVGLFRSSGGPSASLRQELRALSKRVSWPAQSRLEGFVGQLIESENPLDPHPVLADWRRFEQQVESFRFSRLADLKEASLVFESLGGTDPQAAGLNSEWLTRQLQYVVEHGRWVLSAEIIHQLRSDLLGPTAAPFIVVGGSYAETDPLQLQAALQAIAQVEGFPALAANSAQPSLQQWVADAGRWQRFLSDPDIEINLTYLGGGKEKNNSADFYQQLALRLPGLTVHGGAARPELVFSVGEDSGQTTYLWKPQKGRAEASLREMTGRAKDLNAAIEPRISRLSGGSFGLLELIEKHGKPVNERRDQWLVELTIDLSEIQGFENEKIDKPIRTFAIRIDFVDRQGGLPARIAEPDVPTLLGPAPQPPWAIIEKNQ
ncbi:MAG: hypothetical protein IIB58_01905, partial [Planctomycetes bacterium]|nr:hypothetical protein [Planctomycetota bacterium]